LTEKSNRYGALKKKKAAKPRAVFFGSFLDTKKELGCGAKPHCYCQREEKASQ